MASAVPNATSGIAIKRVPALKYRAIFAVPLRIFTCLTGQFSNELNRKYSGGWKVTA